jgi:diacylglycerol kinase (ATP)
MLFLIANPSAGSGRAGRLLPAARAAFIERTERIEVTRQAGDERRLTRQALAAGATTIAVLGGDGTWSNVADELVSSGSACALALLAGGTGNDFARSVGAPADDFARTARLIASGDARRVDVGELEGRRFLNAAGFAFDAAALAQAQRMPWLRGRARYAVASLPILFLYQGIDAAIDPPDDERAATYERRLALVVANGAYFGGAFRIAPDARVDDGLLDLVTIAATSGAGRRARLFAAAMRGSHAGLPGVEMRSAREVRLRFREPPVYEVDGELLRARSAELTVRCVAKALSVVSGAG